MNCSQNKIVITQMQLREKRTWMPSSKTKGVSKQLLRNTGIFAAVSLCIGVGAAATFGKQREIQSVMSHLTAGFEYDDTLGRLQYVSNFLPESAMIFLSDEEVDDALVPPTAAVQTHSWSAEEPWIEYDIDGRVASCGNGEIMTVIKNRQGAYTVRILHQKGYESIYSGLNSVKLKESDSVGAGEQIGTAEGFAAFELRKDGLSVMPVFSAQ